MTFTFDEIFELLEGRSDYWLYEQADKVKTKVYGNTVYLRGIIENTNICARNCLYCGIRAQNEALKRYQLTSDEIMDCARQIREQGLKSIVIQSGENQTVTDRDIARICRRIKQETGADITLSLGEKAAETYRLWKESGADRYLLKVETLQEDLYRALHPGYELKSRIKCVENLKNLGYQVGSGFIAGLPGYTAKMLAADLKELVQIGVHMFSLTPFVHAQNTPLENHPNGNMDIVYRSMAIYRLMAPDTNIPVASACASLDTESKEKGLKRGANVLMLSYTPDKNRQQYALYEGKNTAYNERPTDLKNLVDLITDIGLNPGFEFGRSKYQYKKTDENFEVITNKKAG